MRKIAEGAALMTETKVSIKVLGGLSDTIPNPTLSRLLSDAYLETGAPDFGEEEFAIARASWPPCRRSRESGGEKTEQSRTESARKNFARRPLNTFIMPYTPAMRDKVMTGSSDVGDVSYQVPTAQITAAAGIPETGAHTWQMTAQVGTSIGDKASQAVARALPWPVRRSMEIRRSSIPQRRNWRRKPAGIPFTDSRRSPARSDILTRGDFLSRRRYPDREGIS